jgi:RNA polymerase sigma factor FliA
MKMVVEKYKDVQEKPPRSKKDKQKLIDGLTKEEIVVKYASLVKYLAQKIAMRLPANIELDDLISSGVIGLMDAVDKYDHTRDNKFKTYAEFRIRGAMLDELRSQDWVPRSVREKAKQLERVFIKIEHAKGRPATDTEVCEELKLSPEQYGELLNEVRSVSLLNFDDLNSLTKSDKKSYIGLIENGKLNNPFAEVSRTNLKGMVEKAINDLPEKQRLVLALYYYEEMNLKEIGKVLDVTESRVSQLHTQAILRLKSRLKNNFDEFLQLLA